MEGRRLGDREGVLELRGTDRTHVRLVASDLGGVGVLRSRALHQGREHTAAQQPGEKVQS